MTTPERVKLGTAIHGLLIQQPTPATQIIQDDSGNNHIIAGAGVDPKAQPGETGWMVLEQAQGEQGYWRFFREIAPHRLEVITGPDPELNIQPPRPIVVTGIGRCGTTLMMWMLWAAGVETVFSFGMRPSQELHWAIHLPQHGGWMEAVAGRACKVIDPLTFHPPSGYPYDFVFLTRDHREQARSQMKLLATGFDRIKASPSAIAKMKEGLDRDEPRTRTALMGYKGARVCEIRFEDLITDPATELEQLQTFLRRPLNIPAACKVLVPRHAACRPDMNIEMMMMASCEEAERRHNLPTK